MRTYKQITTKGLEPKLQAIEKQPPKIPGFRMSYLRQIIHWICTKRDDNGYSYLNMKYLKRQIPQAEQYIRFLRNSNLIQRTRAYARRVRSYGYRIVTELESDYVFKSVNDPKLITKLNSQPRKFARGFANQNKLVKSFTMDPQAVNFAEANYSGESLKHAIVSLTMIDNGEKYSTTDDSGGRYYSPITNMPKDLRQFVTVKNKYLIANVDIKNSQPYFSIMILTNPGAVVGFAKDRGFAMVLESLKIPDKDDVRLFIKLVTEGRFYEYLMPYFDAKGLPSTRAEVKDSVMKILFDRNRQRISRSKRIFKRLFPTVFDVFCIVRGEGRGERFPVLLQSIEAYIVLKVIQPRINKEHPDILAFTVHDSLLVTDSPELVKTIMTDELTKFTGYAPIIKIEFFTASPFFESPACNTREIK